MHQHRRRGVTLVEILTVFGVIVILLAILLPALGLLRSNANFVRSQGNLRQIGTWMRSYSTDNREFIVPAAFDYRQNPLPGKVRTASPPGTVMPTGRENFGSWSDILWTDAGLGPVVLGDAEGEYDYRFDSPDRVFFNARPDYRTVLRSDAENTRASGGTDAFPFGTGSQADEKGQPGYFAANGFFDARPVGAEAARWYTTAQIRGPSSSMYLVDSFAGEVIRPECEPFGCEADPNDPLVEVDFRYTGDLCLMLMLDGSVRSEAKWEDFEELETSRGVRIRKLD
jgi:type II secretory pathway pseudopilin PulG